MCFIYIFYTFLNINVATIGYYVYICVIALKITLKLFKGSFYFEFLQSTGTINNDQCCQEA